MKKIPFAIEKEYKNLVKQIKDCNSNLDLLINLADFYLDNELFEYAINEYLNVSLERQTDSIYIKLAYCYIKTNRNTEAIECFSRCRIDNDSLEVIYQCFLSTYDTTTQISIIRKILSHLESYLVDSNYNKIIELVDFVDKFELNDYSCFLIGQILFKYNWYQLSLNFLTRSIKQIEVPISYYLRAQVYKELNETSNALSDIDTLLQEDAEDLDYLYLKGQIYFSNCNYQQAYETFQKISNIDETYKEIFYDIALCLYKLNKNSDALLHLNKSIEQSKNFEKLYLKSKIYYNDLMCDNFVELCSDLLYFKDDLTTLLHILKLHIKCQKFSEGITLGLSYIQYSNNEHYNKYMGCFYYNTKQYKKALEHYKVVLEVDGFHKDRIYFYCGFCCEQTDINLALQYYKKSLEYNNDNKNTIERLEIINEQRKT